VHTANLRAPVKLISLNAVTEPHIRFRAVSLRRLETTRLPLVKPHGYSGEMISQKLNLSQWEMMHKQRLAPGSAVAGVHNGGVGVIVGASRARQIHEEGDVNISASFPAEVKASLRMVQAKTGSHVKEGLAEALRDLFRKYNVPVAVDLRESQ
jgi:hypothetical protein